MATLTIELPNAIKEFVERKAAACNFPTPAEFVQALVANAFRAEERAVIDQQLLEALDEYERGKSTEWTKEEFQKIREDYLRRGQKA